MKRLHEILFRLRALFRREKLDAEMREEMAHHLELMAEEKVAAGASPDEAQHEARRRFGNLGSIQETARDERGWRWLEQIMQDCRYTTRALARTPLFALTAILTLALGLGANTFIFSLVNALILRPLPYQNSAQLVAIWDANPERALNRELVAPGNFLDWQKQNHVFQHATAWYQPRARCAAAARRSRSRWPRSTPTSSKRCGCRRCGEKSFPR